MDDCSFGVTGLRLQGAKCTANRLSLTATIVNELPLTCLKWVRVNPSEAYKKSLGKVYRRERDRDRERERETETETERDRDREKETERGERNKECFVGT